ncbi:hypothetical protein [Flavobacterium sp.]|uniref:hypothetical protein n=1 Tax=Flavobacterium sp. TaxID=239 RepID=UPI0025D6FE4F|nr:hypothetical protein [Flavobacterium sp.]
MDDFRMNRNVVSKSTFEEADDHVTFYKDKTPLERLKAACFIINSIFVVTPATQVDKKVTFARKHVK